VKCKGELLDLHVLVADRVITLSDAEFARKSRDSMLVDADGVTARARDRRGRGLHEPSNARECYATHQCAERVTSQYGASTGENCEARVLKCFEVEDARNTDDGLEKERQNEASATVRAEPGEARVRCSSQAQSPGDQQEGTSEVCASDKRGESASSSPRRQPSP
jgi:hypothetical protein